MIGGDCVEFEKIKSQDYVVGVYFESKEDEKIISDFIGDESIVELVDAYDMFYMSYNAVFITKRCYEQLNLDWYNKEIPKGECILENYKLPDSLIVVVDADLHDNLYDGFVSWEEYKLISSDENFSFIERKLGGYHTSTEIMCDKQKTIVEKVICLNMLASNKYLDTDERRCLSRWKRDIEEALFIEVGVFLRGKAYQTPDGIFFDDMNEVFAHLKTLFQYEVPYSVECILPSVDEWDAEEPIVTLFYNKELQLVDYC